MKKLHYVQLEVMSGTELGQSPIPLLRCRVWRWSIWMCRAPPSGPCHRPSQRWHCSFWRTTSAPPRCGRSPASARASWRLGGASGTPSPRGSGRNGPPGPGVPRLDHLLLPLNPTRYQGAGSGHPPSEQGGGGPLGWRRGHGGS